MNEQTVLKNWGRLPAQLLVCPPTHWKSERRRRKATLPHPETATRDLFRKVGLEDRKGWNKYV